MSDENDARTAELWPEEVDGSTNPLADYAEEAYLSAAAAWLVQAEEHIGLEGTHDGRGYEARAYLAARLAEVTIAMAGACGTYQWRKSLPSMNDAWAAPQPAFDPTADVRAAVQADIAAHEAATLRPGVDPEPAGTEGDLWVCADVPGWFWYAVNDHASPNPGDQHAERWLLTRYYAQVLRWKSERGSKPTPWLWPDIAKAPGTDEPVEMLRRPTAEERATFYGPEPDQLVGQPEDWVGGVVPEVCGKCGGRHVSDCAVPVVAVDDQSEDAAQALERCAKAAEVAGKTRTASWLYECAKRSRAGVQAWPDAPAYKGAVVHVDTPTKDLRALPLGILRGLANDVAMELDRRGA